MEEKAGTKVIEIHPDAKYIIIMDTEGLDPEQREQAVQETGEIVREWWKSESPDPILLCAGIQLVRVDEIEDGGE